MSTNCSRTSFCDYSAGRTKSVFYTAAVLQRERGGKRTKSPATVLLSTVPSFHSKYSFLILLTIVTKLTKNFVRIYFHLDNDIH